MRTDRDNKEPTGRRILFLPVADERGASTRHRVLAHRAALEQAGFITRVRFPLTFARPSFTRRTWRVLDLARDLYSPVRSDLLFIHRKMYPPSLAARMRRKAKRIFFDMDDALDLPPPGKGSGDRHNERYHRNFIATLNMVDLALCANRELAARLPHKRFELLPTPIDTTRFAPGAVSPGEGPVLGWVGYSDNLHYLESLTEPLLEVAKRHAGLRLIVVADRPPRMPGINLEFRRWTLETELSCFAGIRVGLMPLIDSPWARGKSAFKAIQYMALGIPAVASPVGMNREVIRDGGNGFLPADARAWVEVLDRLLSDPDLRASIGREGRKTVERDYSLNVVSRRLVEILKNAPPFFQRGSE